MNSSSVPDQSKKKKKKEDEVKVEGMYQQLKGKKNVEYCNHTPNSEENHQYSWIYSSLSCNGAMRSSHVRGICDPRAD